MVSRSRKSGYPSRRDLIRRVRRRSAERQVLAKKLALRAEAERVRIPVVLGRVDIREPDVVRGEAGGRFMTRLVHARRRGRHDVDRRGRDRIDEILRVDAHVLDSMGCDGCGARRHRGRVGVVIDRNPGDAGDLRIGMRNAVSCEQHRDQLQPHPPPAPPAPPAAPSRDS